MVSPRVWAKGPQEWEGGCLGGVGWEGMGGGGNQVLEGEAHPALGTAFEGSRRLRGEGSSRNGVSRCGWWREERRASRCPSKCKRQSSSLVVLLMAWCWVSECRLGWEVFKAIDNFVHHHGLGYCPTITEWLESQLEDDWRRMWWG